jgi:hypothetical protein
VAVTATTDDVEAWLDVGAGVVDAELLDRVFAAAVGALGDFYDLDAVDVDQDRVNQAAVMYAARLYRRRYSTNGVEAVGDWGPLRVSVSDPDIHALLARWELIRFG